MSDYIIETCSLTKMYGEQASVSDLSIHVKKGRIYGLLGRNGAGKTTTMKMLLGLTAPTSGEVKIFGKPIYGNEKKILPRVGCLIESPGFYPNLTATENLKIFAKLRGLKDSNYIKSALELVNLPYQDKKLFSQYSLGMKQRLAIALAVMHDPAVLILDEPINGLDPIGIAEVIDHGKLLEEESLAELEQKNRHYIHFTVSDSKQAARILETMFQTRYFKITDQHNIHLLDVNLPTAAITRAFVENGLEVFEAHLCEDTLEDYFKKVTGGEGIA